MRYPTRAEILVLHRAMLEQSGGTPGIRDLGARHAALAQPRRHGRPAHSRRHAKPGPQGEPDGRRDDRDRVLPDDRRGVLAVSCWRTARPGPARAVPRGPFPSSAVRPDPLGRAGARPRNLSQHRVRPRTQRLDVCGESDRLYAIRRPFGDHRRGRGAQGPAARRSTRSRARHGVRHRDTGAGRSLHPREAGSGRSAHGIRPSGLPGARSSRRCPGSCCGALLPAGWGIGGCTTWPERSKPRHYACSASAGRSESSIPTSSSTRRSCCMDWDCLLICSHRRSPSHGCSAGQRTAWSNFETAG